MKKEIFKRKSSKKSNENEIIIFLLLKRLAVLKHLIETENLS